MVNSGGFRISRWGGGAANCVGRGRQLPMWLHFLKFACQNKEVCTLRRERTRCTPLDPPLVKASVYEVGDCGFESCHLAFFWDNIHLSFQIVRITKQIMLHSYVSLFFESTNQTGNVSNHELALCMRCYCFLSE